jgi:hypothetical protein
MLEMHYHVAITSEGKMNSSHSKELSLFSIKYFAYVVAFANEIATVQYNGPNLFVKVV